MSQQPKNPQPGDGRDDLHSGEATDGRRAYTPPALVEYGTVAKLTETGGATFFDGGGMMRMACL